MKKNSSEVHDFGPNAQPAEFVFAEAGPSSAEDEGWAMGFVYDKATDKSDLVILDGKRPSGEAVAKIHLPQRVPFGFHGSWIRTEQG